MTPAENINIKFSKKFSKQYDKAPRKIKEAFDQRLALFLEDRFRPLLNNHPLKGMYRNCRSINVTGDWRAIFRELNSGKIIYFDTLGTHSRLYK